MLTILWNQYWRKPSASAGKDSDFRRIDHIKAQIEREDKEILDMVTIILTTQDLWQN